MVVHSQGSTVAPVEIRVAGVLLKQVMWFKYLGFIITPLLSFTAHLTRTTERARAASSVITAVLKRVGICDMKRLGVYLTCYAESQFYCAELLPPAAIDSINSVRSQFVRQMFDLPRTTSHELATILFDVWPTEILLLKRRQRFLRSVLNHDFVCVRDACAIDSALITTTLSWHNSLVRIMRLVDPDLSTVDFNASSALSQSLADFSDRSLVNFHFIKDGNSDSLSFYRLFPSLDILSSFRNFLSSLEPPHCRLVILFCSSLLRFRVCSTICDLCPLCKKPWLWRHFLDCPRLGVTDGASGRVVALQVEACVMEGNWDLFMTFVKANLQLWRGLLSDFALPSDQVDTLC
jgi:hypothetical protein